MSISVLILTLNEIQNLPSCLDSVKWSTDIIILDSFSTDGTGQIARRYGTRVYQRAFDNFAAQRNYAIDNIPFKNAWVLHLDADEIVSEELKNEICSAIANPAFAAYRLASKTMFMGRWLKYAGMYPSYQVRLGKIGALRFKQVGHGQREDMPPDRIGTLQNPLIHYSFSKGFHDWFEKHNRYSTAEASEALASNDHFGIDWAGLFARNDATRRRRALKQLSYRLPFRPTLRFLYMYILRRGFLDGWPGFTYCRLLAMYEYMTVLKMREMRRRREGLGL